jgi:hypothetical protein
VTSLYIAFSDDGQHIRKYSKWQFEGSGEYLLIKPIDAGRFAEWPTSELAGQCRMQASDALDPEYSQFMAAVADRLALLSSQAVEMRERAAKVAEDDVPDDDDPHVAAGEAIAGMRIAAAIRALAVGGDQAKRWRHLKRGTVYEEIGRGELQMSADLVDGSAMVIYRGDDGRLWVREEGEFEDGRFAALPVGEGRSSYNSGLEA